MNKRKPFIKISEKDIERAILQWLNMMPNIFAWKNHTTGIYDTKKQTFRPLQNFAFRGISDIIGVISPTGRLIAIEVKTPETYKIYLKQNTRRATEQKAFLETVKKYGGVAGIATCIEDAQEIIKEFYLEG